MTVQARVHKVVTDHFARDAREPGTAITDDARFYDDLGCDDLDAVEIIMGLEDEFDIEISDDEAADWQTPGAACAAIESRLNGGAHALEKAIEQERAS